MVTYLILWFPIVFFNLPQIFCVANTNIASYPPEPGHIAYMVPSISIMESIKGVKSLGSTGTPVIYEYFCCSFRCLTFIYLHFYVYPFVIASYKFNVICLLVSKNSLCTF